MKLDNAQYRIIVETAPNMIWRSGKDALCDYFNTTWLNFTGRTMEQEVGTGWAEGVHPEDYAACLRTYMEAFAKQEPFEMEYRLKRQDGAWRWIYDCGVPCYINDHEFVGYVGSCIDVTDKIEGQKMTDLAQIDGLTRVYNRQYFEQLATIEFLKALRFKLDLCIVMIDIDQFKQINDNHGHHAGDLVLKEVAQIISQGIRDFDIFGRFGGDEFILLLPHTGATEAAILIKRLENLIGNLTIKYESQIIQVSASFGAYQLHDEKSLEKIIIQADKKLYEIKQAGPRDADVSVPSRP